MPSFSALANHRKNRYKQFAPDCPKTVLKSQPLQQYLQGLTLVIEVTSARHPRGRG